MTYMVEIEEDGRISLPADLREALRLEAGARLSVRDHPADDTLTLHIEREPVGQVGLFYEDGLLVYDAPGADPSFDVVAAIAEMREERMRHVMAVSVKSDEAA